MKLLKGHLAIEGGEYVGKSSTVEELLKLLPEAIRVREPGGTPVGELLRSIARQEHDVFQCEGKELGLSNEETLALMMTSRSLLVRNLEAITSEDDVVIWDRSYLTSWVYQVIMKGAPTELFFALLDGLNIKLPEHLFILTVSEEEFLRRKAERGEENDPLGQDATVRRSEYDAAYKAAAEYWQQHGVKCHIIDTSRMTPKGVATVIESLL